MLDFLVLTFSNLVESKGKVDEERGELDENIVRDFIKSELEKVGELQGLAPDASPPE